jgi:hypothetical protein
MDKVWCKNRNVVRFFDRIEKINLKSHKIEHKISSCFWENQLNDRSYIGVLGEGTICELCFH